MSGSVLVAGEPGQVIELPAIAAQSHDLEPIGWGITTEAMVAQAKAGDTWTASARHKSTDRAIITNVERVDGWDGLDRFILKWFDLRDGMSYEWRGTVRAATLHKLLLAVGLPCDRWTLTPADKPVHERTKVYAIQAVGTGLVKIGKAKNVLSRLATLQTSSPHDLIVVTSTEETDDRTEATEHVRFADKRVRGEWFDFSPELAAGLTIAEVLAW